MNATRYSNCRSFPLDGSVRFQNLNFFSQQWFKLNDPKEEYIHLGIFGAEMFGQVLGWTVFLNPAKMMVFWNPQPYQKEICRCYTDRRHDQQISPTSVKLEHSYISSRES